MSLTKKLLLEFGEQVPELAKTLARYSDNQALKKIALTMVSELIKVDLWEMESLTNPDKFEFPETEIGQIGVESEKNDT